MLEQNPIGKGSALAQTLSFGALISTGLRLVSRVGEHPGEGDLGFLLRAGDRGTVLVLLRLPWLSAVCSPGICDGASSFHKLCQGLQESCRPVWPGTALLVAPSMSPKLGKGPLDKGREGEKECKSGEGKWKML